MNIFWLNVCVLEMGVCAGDFTSVNQHSDIWMAYNVLLTALLPCAIALFCCSAICVRQFRLGVDAVKSSIPDDLFFIKALTVVSWLSFGTHLAFIVINIMFARGTHFTPTTLLSMTYLVHINRLSLYIIWCLVDGTPFIAIGGIGRNILRLCTTVNGVFKSESNTSRSFNSQAATPVSVWHFPHPIPHPNPPKLLPYYDPKPPFSSHVTWARVTTSRQRRRNGAELRPLGEPGTCDLGFESQIRPNIVSRFVNTMPVIVCFAKRVRPASLRAFILINVTRRDSTEIVFKAPLTEIVFRTALNQTNSPHTIYVFCKLLPDTHYFTTPNSFSTSPFPQ